MIIPCTALCHYCELFLFQTHMHTIKTVKILRPLDACIKADEFDEITETKVVLAMACCQQDALRFALTYFMKG